MPKLPIVVLISGNGSNLQAIIDQCSGHVDIRAVISDNPKAYGLQRALDANIRPVVESQVWGENRHDYCYILADKVSIFKPELVVLAGFMKILTPEFTTVHERTMNIHPSLLPKHKGLHTHRRVLEAGDKEHGMTIHWVTEELDSGPIIWQQSFEVQPDDTEETLEAKVHELEHIWYPRMINEAANGNI